MWRNRVFQLPLIVMILASFLIQANSYADPSPFIQVPEDNPTEQPHSLNDSSSGRISEKKMWSLVLSGAALIVGCVALAQSPKKGKEGVQGPTGGLPNGAKGADGPDGATGATGSFPFDAGETLDFSINMTVGGVASGNPALVVIPFVSLPTGQVVQGSPTVVFGFDQQTIPVPTINNPPFGTYTGGVLIKELISLGGKTSTNFHLRILSSRDGTITTPIYQDGDSIYILNREYSADYTYSP